MKFILLVALCIVMGCDSETQEKDIKCLDCEEEMWYLTCENGTIQDRWRYIPIECENPDPYDDGWCIKQNIKQRCLVQCPANNTNPNCVER